MQSRRKLNALLKQNENNQKLQLKTYTKQKYTKQKQAPNAKYND